MKQQELKQLIDKVLTNHGINISAYVGNSGAERAVVCFDEHMGFTWYVKFSNNKYLWAGGKVPTKEFQNVVYYEHISDCKSELLKSLMAAS